MPRSTTPRPTGWTTPPLEEAGEGDLVITHSEIEAYRQCPLKWFLGYKQRWTQQDREDDHPLTKGILWHEVMETHYGVIKEWSDRNGPITLKTEGHVLNLCLAAINPLVTGEHGERTELQGLIWWMYQAHVEKYGADIGLEILGVEVKFQARLHDNKGNPTRILLKGKLDLVVRDRRTRKIWIVDHKSGKDLPDQLELDVADQFGLYAWLLRQAGIEIIGVQHWANRTTMNMGDRPENQDAEGNPLKSTQKKQTLEQRLRRTLVNRGARELDSIALDAWSVAVNAYPEYAGLAPLPVYSSPDPRQCSWKCDFLDAHLMARKGRVITVALQELGFKQHFEERY